MGHDYVVYVHGVNVRDQHYADALDLAIKTNRNQADLTSIPIYWGDISAPAEAKLLQQWQSSKLWNGLWFPELRSSFLLQFVGDAVQYISRAVGAQVVKRICDKAIAAFQARRPGADDRLHLITHSWGTVILLDVLFASRWDGADAPPVAKAQVQQIRDMLFGIEPNPENGIKLASITTMGSPFSLFSLLDVSDPSIKSEGASSHDISDTIEKLCTNLHGACGVPLKWRNFIHPGDPVAYPIAPLVQSMLKPETVDIADAMTHLEGLLDLASHLLGHNNISITDAAHAHNSYWTNKQVATGIQALISPPPHSTGTNGSRQVLGISSDKT
jgi:hypothetical protein